MTRTLVTLCALALAAASFHAGCGGSDPVADFCKHACDCEGSCDEKKLKACEDDAKKTEEAAKKAGCESAFDDLLACGTSARCTDGKIDLEESCTGEDEVFITCVGPQPGG